MAENTIQAYIQAGTEKLLLQSTSTMENNENHGFLFMFVKTENSDSGNEQPNPSQGASSSNAQNNPKQDKKDPEMIRLELIEQLVAREAANAPRSDLRILRSYFQDRFSVDSGDRAYLDWKLVLTDEE